MPKSAYRPPVKTYDDTLLFNERVNILDKELREYNGGLPTIECEVIMSYFHWKRDTSVREHLKGVHHIGNTKCYHIIDVARKITEEEFAGAIRKRKAG